MKYVDTQVVFREVPEEITLAVNISQCPVKCPGCHSSYLAQDIGEPLSEDVLDSLIASNQGISCVSFMGGDGDLEGLKHLALHVRSFHPTLKLCWYSGRDLENAKASGLTEILDYVKVGPFIDEYGPLDYPSTNQRFYKIERSPEGVSFTDWTAKFRKRFI